ncbi:MAG: alpha/beta hydrolase fold domain-containing protein [Nocardioidaceae bacterium]
MDEESGMVLSMPQAPDAIELRHLRSFVAVAEELNFGRAAERLYLSQPALSRQISGLERLVGCDLLRRSTHRVELTIAGEALLDKARSILHDLDDAVTTTRSVGGELASRVARLWEPVMGVSLRDVDLPELRAAYEALHAKFAAPPGIDVRPVNAGGVPSLLLTPDPDQPTTMLYLHGGGNTLGSAFGYRPLVGALVAAAETGAVVPDYRLAPEHPFPAGLHDALRVYEWMLASGTDPQDVTLAGDSSGGGLSVSLMLLLKQRALPLPGRAVLLCPGVDLTGTQARGPADEPLPPEQVGMLRRFASAYLAGHSLDDPLVSPLRADLSGLPPMLIQSGTGDIVLRETHQLADLARDHGVDVRLELFPVSTHVFHFFWSFLPEGADAIHQAGRFIREQQAGVADSQSAG